MLAVGRFARSFLAVLPGPAAPATPVPATTPAAAPPSSSERRLTDVMTGPWVWRYASMRRIRRATPKTCWGNREDSSHRRPRAGQRSHRPGQTVEGPGVPAGEVLPALEPVDDGVGVHVQRPAGTDDREAVVSEGENGVGEVR